MNFVKILLPAIIATTLAWLPAGAVDTRKIELTMTVGGKPYDVVAEPSPVGNWRLKARFPWTRSSTYNRTAQAALSRSR